MKIANPSLKRNNLVNACYTRDGIVTIKISDRFKAITVYHINDLLDLFPDFHFDDEPFHDASPYVSAQSMYWVRWIWLLLTCCVISVMARKLGLCPLTWITLLIFNILIFCAFNLLFQNLGQKNKKYSWFLQSVH